MHAARAVESTVARGRAESLALWSLVTVLALLVLKCAWVCDDAYITFRVADNVLAGFGPRWNTAERVQAYTNPLWMAAMVPLQALFGGPYLASIGLGLVLTACTALLVAWRAARDFPGAVLALAVLACSKAFVDFSTSGLENALLHFGLVLTFLAAASERAEPRRSLELGLCAFLVALTRIDGLVVLAPLFVQHVVLHHARRSWAGLALGLLPLALFEAFSLVYYGALVPNTAIAKLSTGIPQAELARQGLAYLLDALRRDGVTLPAIAAAIAVAGLRRERVALALALGALAHLAYVVHVGGDFMSGRFLTAPLCAAVFVLARAGLDGRAVALLAGATLVAAGLHPLSPLRAPLDYAQGRKASEFISADGIADERGYWHTVAGLFSANRADDDKLHVSKGHPFARQLREEGPKVLRAEGIGYLGYWAGPAVHLVDPMGLSDAFLARLPIYVDGRFVEPAKNAANGARGWRIGHYYRAIPEGYLESLTDPSRQISDARLRELRSSVELLTRAPLFDGARWRAIARHLW
jgi:arabinofuranosyltransferase